MFFILLDLNDAIVWFSLIFNTAVEIYCWNFISSLISEHRAILRLISFNLFLSCLFHPLYQLLLLEILIAFFFLFTNGIMDFDYWQTMVQPTFYLNSEMKQRVDWEGSEAEFERMNLGRVEIWEHCSILLSSYECPIPAYKVSGMKILLLRCR